MRTEDPPITFVAVWGAFALLMLFGQLQLAHHGVKIPVAFQVEVPGEPMQFAALG